MVDDLTGLSNPIPKNKYLYPAQITFLKVRFDCSYIFMDNIFVYVFKIRSFKLWGNYHDYKCY